VLFFRNADEFDENVEYLKGLDKEYFSELHKKGQASLDAIRKDYLIALQ
jgi:hypothetical protein